MVATVNQSACGGLAQSLDQHPRRHANGQRQKNNPADHAALRHLAKTPGSSVSSSPHPRRQMAPRRCPAVPRNYGCIHHVLISLWFARREACASIPASASMAISVPSKTRFCPNFHLLFPPKTPGKNRSPPPPAGNLFRPSPLKFPTRFFRPENLARPAFPFRQSLPRPRATRQKVCAEK